MREMENVYYALLSYSTNNLGDDIQSIAAAQFLPRIDFTIDRDYMDKVPKVKGKIKIIMNGWFAHRLEGWPLPEYIDPLFVSFHITPSIVGEFLTPEIVNYLKKFKVGCRDTWTMELLRNHGINAYFSGCLTLTLNLHYKTSKKEDYILLVDLPVEILKILPQEIIKNSKIRSNHVVSDLPGKNILRRVIPSAIRRKISRIYRSYMKKKAQKPPPKRFELARQRIYEVARAKLVITTRLHIALPAVALDTPVILVARNPKDPRFSGLSDLMNMYSFEEFKYVAKNIEWCSIRNPNQEKLKDLQKKLIDTITEFLGQ